MLRDYEIPLLEEMLKEEENKNTITLASNFVEDLLVAYKELKERKG